MGSIQVKTLGFTGQARSGKDSAAGFLRQELLTQSRQRYDILDTSSPAPAWVHQLALADILKAMLVPLLTAVSPSHSARHEYAYECLYGELKEQDIELLGTSPRRLMQTLGTEWGRGYVADDIWLRVATARMQQQEHAARMDSTSGRPQYLVHIITDIRYDNEVELCDKVYRVTRAEVPEVAAHVSEAGISDDHITATISNDGTIEALHKKMAVLATSILEEFDSERVDSSRAA